MASISVASPASDEIGLPIILLRGQKVLLDADLARLYGVTTARLNEQVRRNVVRFPGDFMFQVSNQEFIGLMSQFATSNRGRGGTRKRPLAFTEHGAIMAAAVLNTVRAIETSVFIVRAFVRMHNALASHAELAKKLEDLEKKTEALSSRQDALAAETRSQLKKVIEAIRALMTSPPTKGRPIGFVTPREA